MLGFPPAAIDGMTPWEFGACVDGYVAAHSPEEEPPPMDREQLAALGIEGF